MDPRTDLSASSSRSDRGRVVIAGGTGTLGQRLADHFAARGHDVVVLTRSPRPGATHRQVAWDGRTAGAWARELEGATVVNLAGLLVDRRPTRRNVELLRSSRVDPTVALVEASRTVATPPRLWLQMSTLAFYGDRGDEVLTEQSAPGDGPPQQAGVATAWEAAAAGAVTDRLVVLRTAIVLDNDTPVLDRLTGVTRWGLGGRIGDGRQWVSWVHVEDFLRAVDHLCDDAGLSGPFNVTAPEPVRNADMMETLRHALGRPWSPPTPAPLVRVGAWLMGTDAALALTGRRCVPRRLLDAGFTFSHPTFDDAVADLFAARPR